MAVIGVKSTPAPAPWPPVATVAVEKVAVSLSAEVVAIFMLSLNAPLLKSFAASEARKVELLSKTVTEIDPAGAKAERGDEGDGRDVVALADALRSVAACAFSDAPKTAKHSATTIIP